MAQKITPASIATSETALACIARADGSRVTVVVAVDPDDKAKSARYLDPEENVVPFDAAAGDVISWGACPVNCEWISSETLVADGSANAPAGATSLYAQNRSDGDVEVSRDGSNWFLLGELDGLSISGGDLSNVQFRKVGANTTVSIVINYNSGGGCS